MRGPRRHPRGWYDLAITIARCVTTLLGDIIRKGGHL
jgi:hypothetical protein